MTKTEKAYMEKSGRGGVWRRGSRRSLEFGFRVLPTVTKGGARELVDRAAHVDPLDSLRQPTGSIMLWP